MNGTRLHGPVRIVGAGLLGASAGLALSQRGIDVAIHDISPAAVALAIDYGAGRRATDADRPTLVIVAVPPDQTAHVIAAELSAYPEALVTDVASVKALPLAELEATGADTSRYLGSHPLAGRERGGVVSARADLFLGRPWVITSRPGTTAAQVGVIEDLVLDLGAVPVHLSVEEHDRAVALVSHAPQVIATVLAAELVTGSERALSLSGQGLRDTTRIAASEPELWTQILAANSAEVSAVLHGVRDRLDEVIGALDDPQASGARRRIAESLSAGNAGVARIPGKHGQDRKFSQLVVMVDDTPGELARLLTEIGEIGVNLEDVRLEHSPGAQIGLAEISVLPEVEQKLLEELEARNWRIAGAWT
ncbi:MAG: prephenate dehydrogenase [Cryobacterium sp.]|nr:prephenate dehydrogenase [Cryobacterium sp.]